MSEEVKAEGHPVGSVGLKGGEQVRRMAGKVGDAHGWWIGMLEPWMDPDVDILSGRLWS